MDSLIATPKGNIEIGKLRDGDTVVTVHPDTKIRSNSVIHSYFIKKGRVYQYKTLGGFNVTATSDHPFLTRVGWVKCGFLQEQDEVLTTYTMADASSLVDEQLICDNIYVKNVKDSIITKNTHKLRELGVLPLHSTSKYTPILARMIGYSFADASLTYTEGTLVWCGCFGTYEDAEEFENDVRELGINTNPIRKVTTSMVSDDGRTVVQTTYRVRHGNPLALLLAKMGAPIGKKTTQPFKFPNWIKNGSQKTQREFVAGFQGGDGGSPCWAKRKNKKK